MSRLTYDTEIRWALIDELVEAGDLIRRGDDHYEDMGGHVLHESNLDIHIRDYLNRLGAIEFAELKDRLGLGSGHSDSESADAEYRAAKDAEVPSLNRKD